METITLSGTNIEECAARAAGVLRAGGIVLYPTDTIYGLGADAFSDDAVSRVYAIKGRDERKPIHCIVADFREAEKYAEFNDAAVLLARAFWPGALTLVLNKKVRIDAGIGNGIDTIGIRVPDHDFCLALAKEFGKPFTTTSANVSGMETLATTGGVLEQIGEARGAIDLVVGAGELPPSAPSTIVDICSESPVILREGAIPAGEIFDVLGRLSRERDGL